MKLRYARELVAAAWLASLGSIGIVSSVTSVSGWIVLSMIAVIPLVIMHRLWRYPSPTLSESIQEARR